VTKKTYSWIFIYYCPCCWFHQQPRAFWSILNDARSVVPKNQTFDWINLITTDSH